MAYHCLVQHRSLRLGRVLALLVGWSACACSAVNEPSDAGPAPPDASALAVVPNRCDGPAPPISDCVTGDAWAECGGTGTEPRFACEASGGLSGYCLWFANGCVAEGFIGTDCPAADLCCIEAPRGSSPYPAELSSSLLFAIGSTTVGWGLEPWDRTRAANVGVILAATSTDARPFVACTAGRYAGPCASDPSEPGLRFSRGLNHGVLRARVVDIHYPIQLHRLSLEIMRADDGTLTSRACRVAMTDAFDGTCHVGPSVCATSGTVTLPSFPETDEEAASIPIDVDAVMADGSTMMLRL
jgi:hypothetical protein